MGRRTTSSVKKAAALFGGVIIIVLGLAAVSLTNPARTSWASVRANDDGGDSLSLRRERLLLYERSFRPSTYDAPLRPLSPSSLPGDSAAAGFEPRDTYAAPETVQGYRIQVLNTNNYDESSAVRNQLLSAFDTWWVYVLYEAPTYKVRIGDFATRLEAKTALEQIQQNGFTNAWLVPDKVVLHLPPRMPLATPIDSATVK